MSIGQRRLAAIMFTDIVGYAFLTQKDESSTLQALENHRRLLRPHFSSHGGREIKTIGDAFLVQFKSALDAVLCSIAIQQAVHDRKLATGDTISVRIGIHIGDVVERGNDILGDAVNIASRIEPLAEAGGVCISGEVYSQVRNKSDLTFVSLGEKSLKNLNTPVELYKVKMPWENESTGSATQFDSRRIAVLPFANMSPDPNDEYFADGMTEELIDRLAQVKGIEVIARTSVMSYKKNEKKISEIAKELETGSVVEGSVRKAGDKVRVTAQLINGATQGHIWSSRYDGNLDDIFAVQSEIAEKVAGELKVQLLNSEKAIIEKRPTEDTVAYTYYLRGMQLVNQLEEAPLRNAMELFQEAVARDPSFARAYAGMARCYFWLANWGFILTQEAIEKGRAAAQKALELDPDLAEGHHALANVMFLADEHQGSLHELRKAIELNPSFAAAYIGLVYEYAAFGNSQEMVRAAEKGYQLDPLFPTAISWVGTAFFYTGRGEEAMEHWKKTLRLEPYRTYRSMFDYYVSKGDYVEAERTVKEMERLGPTLKYTFLNRGYLAALTGDGKTAREMIAKLEAGKEEGLGTPSLAGLIYYPLGDMDRFFECMLRAAEDHTLFGPLIRLNPLFEKAAKDPRWGEVFRRAGLQFEPQN